MKKGEEAPFITIAKETVEMQAMIHLMKGASNPRWVRSSLMYDQLTLSKALERSIFRIVPFDFLVVMLCKPYYTTPMASCICLPSKKPNCSLEIDLERIGFSLRAIIFTMIL